MLFSTPFDTFIIYVLSTMLITTFNIVYISMFCLICVLKQHVFHQEKKQMIKHDHPRFIHHPKPTIINYHLGASPTQ